MVTSLREKIEAPKVVREILEGSARLLDLIAEDGSCQPEAIRVAAADLRGKFEHLDEVRRGG